MNELLKGIFISGQCRSDRASLFVRCALYLVFLWWSFNFIFDTAPMADRLVTRSFWHNVNLPFHEAGHIIFGFTGRFIASLGGTLGQLLMPLICAATLLIKTRDPFGASIATWWMAQSTLDIAPYINDARELSMPLLGGNVGSDSPYGFHDWNYLLTEINLLNYDTFLAIVAYSAGSLLMLFSMIWAGVVLFNQYSSSRPKKVHSYFDIT